ncbi:MAG: hypothetical protein ACRYGM_27855 [Janthinobacterium lividum]
MLALFPIGRSAADPAPPVVAAPDERHKLAMVFLDKLQADSLMKQLIQGSRANVIVIFHRIGKTEQQAGEIFDQFMLPEFLARIPELRQQFEDILATDFTETELRSVLENQQNEARQTAIAKAPQMQAEFTKAGQDWGRQVGQDAYTKNKAALQKLGMD